MEAWKDKSAVVAREIRAHEAAARETYLQSPPDAGISAVLLSIWQAWEDALRNFNRACARAEAAASGDGALYRAIAAGLREIGSAKDDPERSGVFTQARRIAMAGL